jgi:hypothetical protein
MNCLEKTPWKTRGGDRVTLTPYFTSVRDTGRRLPNYATTHVEISQLVNKICSQQACSKLANKL